MIWMTNDISGLLCVKCYLYVMISLHYMRNLLNTSLLFRVCVGVFVSYIWWSCYMGAGNVADEPVKDALDWTCYRFSFSLDILKNLVWRCMASAYLRVYSMHESSGSRIESIDIVLRSWVEIFRWVGWLMIWMDYYVLNVIYMWSVYIIWEIF